MKVDVELLTNQDIYSRVMREEIPSARHSVIIASALVKQTTIELDDGSPGPFLELVDRLVARGVAVYLLFSGNPSAPFMATLRKYPHLLQPGSGFNLRICVRNHMKVVLVDGARLYLGSANLTGAGLGQKSMNKRNFEFGIFTTDPRIIQRLARAIQEIWELDHCEACRAKRLCRTHNERFSLSLLPNDHGSH